MVDVDTNLHKVEKDILSTTYLTFVVVSGGSLLFVLTFEISLLNKSDF